MNLKKLGGKIFDQLNPLDNGRTYQNSQGNGQNVSVGGQVRQIGKAIVRPPSQFINTTKAGVGGAYGLGKVGVSSIFGDDQDYANTVRNVSNTLTRDLNPNAGVMGQGTYFKDRREAETITPRALAGKSIAQGAQLAPFLTPEVKLVNNPLVNRLITNAVIGGGGSAGGQYAETGKINPKKVGTDALTAAALGEVVPLAKTVVKGAKPVLASEVGSVGKNVNQKIETVYRSENPNRYGVGQAELGNGLYTGSKDIAGRLQNGKIVTDGLHEYKVNPSAKILDSSSDVFKSIDSKASNHPNLKGLEGRDWQQAKANIITQLVKDQGYDGVRRGTNQVVAMSDKALTPLTKDAPIYNQAFPGAKITPELQSLIDSAPPVKAKSLPLPTVKSPAPNLTPDATLLNPAGKGSKNTIFEELSKAQNAPRVEEALTASKVATKGRELGVKLDQDFINRYQAGKLSGKAEKEMGAYIQSEITDPLLARQQALDPTVQRRQNYVPQSYSQGAELIDEAARQLQLRTKSANPRSFKSYAEASEFGLTPKHKTLDQMLGTNAGEVARAEANRQLITKGLDEGVFQVNGEQGRVPITGFQSEWGEQIYAPKDIADKINGIVQRDSSGLAKTLHGTAKASQIAQDVALQGGVPGTNANFFVFGQGVKDTTRNIGKFSFHPIQAVKQEGNLIGDFFRGNKGTQKRFAKNADFVQAMADRGLPITPQTSLSGVGKNVIDRGWDTLGNNPTFGRYMPNRMLSTSQEIYQQSLGKLGHEGALDLAASQTKAFAGIVDQVAKGRTNLTADGIATAFFAPKYRESIIHALTNAAKSVTTELGNPNFKASRELVAGMAVTLAGYEVLNRQLNGHSMLDNREGQEISLQIPYGPKDDKGNQPVINVPFMPGFMTIPRAIAGAASSAAHANPKGVIAEGSKLLSMPLNTAGAVIGNKDYFGRPIYVDQATADKEGVTADSPGTAAKKVGGYVAGQLSPAWVRAGIGAAQGKPTVQNLATATEAPLRFGKVTNPDTVAYFKNRDDFYKGLNKNERTLFDQLNPKKKDIKGGDIAADKSTLTTSAKYGDLLANPDFTSKYQTYKQNEKNHDPLWDLNTSQLRSYVQAQVISKNDPGGDSTTTSALYKRLPADFFTKREQYFGDLKSKGVDLGGSDYKPRPKMPDNLVAFSENYHTLPYGTGARSKALRSTEGQAYITYLDNNRIYNNQERADLGLPPLEDKSNQYGESSNKSGYRGGGGGSNRSAGSAYKYAVSANAGGKIAKPSVKKVSSGKVASAKKKGSSKPKVTSKKSMV